MANSKKGNSKRHRNQSRPSPLPILLALGGLVLVILAIFFALGGGKPATPYNPEVTGGPSLKADKDKVDLGNQKLGNQARVSFTLTNVGDKPLRFTKEPYIEVKEGCWPPTPAIGSMALNPGETTTLSMEFLMHGDMGGKHDFRVHLLTNDPANGDRTLTVLSNWVP